MKNDIKNILLHSTEPIQELETLCKERISKAVNKVIFYCISALVVWVVVLHLIIK